jgi:hypothetical protein
VNSVDQKPRILGPNSEGNGAESDLRHRSTVRHAWIDERVAPVRSTLAVICPFGLSELWPLQIDVRMPGYQIQHGGERISHHFKLVVMIGSRKFACRQGPLGNVRICSNPGMALQRRSEANIPHKEIIQ